MVEMETLRSKLEQVVGGTLHIKELSKQQSEAVYLPVSVSSKASSKKGKQTEHRSLQDVVMVEDKMWFPLFIKNGRVQVIEASSELVNDEVARLIGVLLSAVREQTGDAVEAQGDEERELLRLSQWIQEQLDLGHGDAELPDDLELKRLLSAEMTPFLLTCESIHASDVKGSQLKKLLRSYFDGEVVLAALRDNEWLILARKELVAGSNDEKEEDNGESETDMLSAFCMGLYELIASEWVGAFHLSAAPSFIPLKSLPGTVGMLRETIFLGRTFHVSEHVHFPWELLLERLIYSIPMEQRRHFLEQAGDHGVLFSDNETLSTLETFFQLDCNVSETAKRLYIHRNTLLYRLDKIKQETNLDVRSFGDAVLVKLTMLLYKVTKRK